MDYLSRRLIVCTGAGDVAFSEAKLVGSTYQDNGEAVIAGHRRVSGCFSTFSASEAHPKFPGGGMCVFSELLILQL